MGRLIRFEVGVMVGMALALTTGCGAKPEDPPAPPAQGDKKPVAKGWARKLQRPNVQNELKEIRLFYIQYLDAHPNRPPADMKAFQEFFKRDSNQLYRAFEDGYYQMNLKARQEGTALLAWEAEPDENGNVLAIRMQGGADPMPLTQVKAELPK